MFTFVLVLQIFCDNVVTLHTQAVINLKLFVNFHRNHSDSDRFSKFYKSSVCQYISSYMVSNIMETLKRDTVLIM